MEYAVLTFLGMVVALVVFAAWRAGSQQPSPEPERITARVVPDEVPDPVKLMLQFNEITKQKGIERAFQRATEQMIQTHSETVNMPWGGTAAPSPKP